MQENLSPLGTKKTRNRSHASHVAVEEVPRQGVMLNPAVQEENSTLNANFKYHPLPDT